MSERDLHKKALELIAALGTNAHDGNLTVARESLVLCEALARAALGQSFFEREAEKEARKQLGMPPVPRKRKPLKTSMGLL